MSAGSRCQSPERSGAAGRGSEHGAVLGYAPRRAAQAGLTEGADHMKIPYESKYPYGTLGVSHCNYWADLDLKQAKEAEALAALHEDMAKAAEQKH
jgi:hypothetical protein